MRMFNFSEFCFRRPFGLYGSASETPDVFVKAQCGVFYFFQVTRSIELSWTSIQFAPLKSQFIALLGTLRESWCPLKICAPQLGHFVQNKGIAGKKIDMTADLLPANTVGILLNLNNENKKSRTVIMFPLSFYLILLLGDTLITVNRKYFTIIRIMQLIWYYLTKFVSRTIRWIVIRGFVDSFNYFLLQGLYGLALFLRGCPTKGSGRELPLYLQSKPPYVRSVPYVQTKLNTKHLHICYIYTSFQASIATRVRVWS